MAKTFTHLTRPAMRKLAAGDKLAEHGITFERLANGDGAFTVNVMVDGQRIHRVVGRESDGTTRTQAEDFIAKVRSDAKHGRLALPKGRKLVMSFREAAKKYLTRLEEEGGRNVEKKRRQLALHLVPFFKDTPLSQIASFDLERYKKWRRENNVIKSHTKSRGPTFKGRGAASGTINRELAVMSQLFTKAVDWGWIDKRPAKINRLAEGGGRIVYLTVDEVQRLVECARLDPSPLIYPFVVIALGTAMRKMEVLSIRKEDVDLDRRMIHVPLAKAGARDQPITANVAEFLKSYITTIPVGSPWLFPSPGAREGHAVDVRKAFRRVAVAAGLDPNLIVRHTLRHTAITQLVQAGVDLPTVQRISGHKTPSMVHRYAHANGMHINSAMDKLDAAYSAAGDEAVKKSPGSPA